MTFHPLQVKLAVVALAAAVGACSNGPVGPSPVETATGTTVNQFAIAQGHDHHTQDSAGRSMAGNFAQTDPDLLRRVTQATARFHSTTQASRAGYTATPCVAVPGVGGMGEHWVNEALIDTVFDPLQPEVLLYEPQQDGTYRLVAIEYIVIDIGQERPSFGGHLFDVDGTPIPAPHWSLHVWLWRDNPNGLFTPFNPSVTCP